MSKQIETAIDKKFKSDMAQIVVHSMGRTPESTGTKQDFERYTVVTRATPPTKQEIDYTTFPNRSYSVININSVQHEDPISAYDRAHVLKYHPRRVWKEWRSIRQMQKMLGEK